MSEPTALATAPDKVGQVFTWILSGAAEHEIIESIRQFWPAEEPKPLIVAAFERIVASGDEDAAGTVRGWCIEATRHIYQQALQDGDLATALRAIKQIHSFAALIHQRHPRVFPQDQAQADRRRRQDQANAPGSAERA